jgi:flagella basal body P-ring formation protein FlgA
MKCSRRSTRSSASAVLALALTLLSPDAVSSATRDQTPTAVAAVQASVLARIGGRAVVTVDEIVAVRIDAAAGTVVAVPEPAARIGRVARFLLAEKSAGGRVRRVGEISARVGAHGPVMRATRAIAAGDLVAADAVTEGDADLDGLPLRPLPAVDGVIGARARRPVAAGAILSSGDVAPALLVRAGEMVTVRVAIGGVTVTGRMVAAGSGARGDVVRVVNAGNRRAQRARVVAPAEVEMIDVH